MTILPGFVDLEDLMNDRVANIGVERISDAIQTTLDGYNMMVNEELAVLVGSPVTTAQWKRRQLGARRMQPLDADGNPVAQTGIDYYEVGVPVWGMGDAYGMNRITSRTMTVQEMNDIMAEIMIADKNAIQRHIIKALVYSADWTWHDIYRPETPDITVYPLANGDSVVYPKMGSGTLTIATDDHYLSQANAIDNSNNPFPTIYEELREHPENQIGYRGTPTGYVIAYVAPNLTTSIQNLNTLVEVTDAFVTPGISTDNLDNSVYAVKGFGGRVVGIDSGCIIVEWGLLPDDYIFARAPLAGNVLSMRELDIPDMRGLFEETHLIDGNHVDRRMLRWAGIAVTNRTGGLMMQIESGSYTNPAGYDPRVND